MRSGHDAGQGAIAVGQCHVKVGGGVGGDLEAERPSLRGDPVMGDLLTLAISRAGDANAVVGALTDVGEQAFGEGKAFGERPVEGGGICHDVSP